MIIQFFNLFPESRYLRCRSRPDFDYKCGGVASLLILAIMLTLLITKLKQCLSYSTVFFKERTLIDTIPRKSILTTHKDDASIGPFMLSLSPNNECQNNITAKHMSIDAQGRSITEFIPLEDCTQNHFAQIPNLGVSFIGVKCLPLNRQISLGGSKYIANNQEELIIQISCSCGSNCGSPVMSVANAYVNPSDEKLLVYSFDQYAIDLGQATSSIYSAVMDQNIARTDSSLFPLSSRVSAQSSFRVNQIKKTSQQNYAWLTSRQTTVKITRSTFTKQIEREYLKLIDVFSYVGGFFPSLFALFFFLKYFGFYYYESLFTFIHFKCSQTRDFGIQMYLKRIIYAGLRKINMAQNWKVAQKQAQINEFTNKMLDVNYLYKRIEFLETAISSLLSDHQLKGVYLSQVSIMSAKKQYKKHILRDRLIKFLLQKADADKQKRVIEEERMKKIEDKMIKLRPQSKTQIAESNRQLVDQEMIDMPKLGRKSTKMVEEVEQKELERGVRQRGYKERIGYVRQSHEQFEMPPELEDHIINPRDWNRILLKKQVQMMELAEEKDFDSQAVRMELEGDLKRLLNETDSISRRIVSNIDSWFKEELEIAIKDHEIQRQKAQKRQLVEVEDNTGSIKVPQQ